MTTLTRRGFSKLGAIGGLGWFFKAAPAAAEELTMTPEEIVDVLDQPEAPAGTNEGLATRAMRIRKSPTQRKVELTIFFDTDSARITRRSMVQLEPLGEALQSPRLRRSGFVIIGHTDGRGDPDHNRWLSLRRARAVRRYLSEAYGISAKRLAVRGAGSDQPRDPYNLAADVNRRVEVAPMKRQA